MGYGTVGSGVAEVISGNHDSIIKKSGKTDIKIKYILDLRDFPGDPNEDKFIKDFKIIENDPEVKVVVETMGGLRFAYDYVLRCLKAGKSVVTSNKELVAEKGAELLKVAKDNNLNFLFEASVGGGIPIIRPINQCLAANRIDEIAGILNGTTNFILTMMIDKGMKFEEALKLAQDNGYAEKDPTADVEGIDACRKICILAALCFGKHVYPNEVYTEGITKITLEDVKNAASWGGVIKLIARSKRIGENKISAMVSPAFVKNSSQLAGVNDVFNAILVRGNATGDVVFYGKGAGKLPTASAVVADVIDCALHTDKRKTFGWDEGIKNYVIDHSETETAFYVRAEAVDSQKAVDCAKDVFGKVEIIDNQENSKEVAFVTPYAKEKELKRKLNTIEGIKILSLIRVVDY